MATLYSHTDVDGDRIAVFPADIPGQGPGVNIRTDAYGSSLPINEISKLITALRIAMRDQGHWAGEGFTKQNQESTS